MKRNLKQLTLGLVLASSFLSACSQEKDRSKETNTVTVANSMSSSELTNAAEQLVGPYTFMLAYKTALKAVEKDPTNLKAQFYVNLLKRTEVFRGILTRVRPLMKTPEQIKNLDLTIKNIPNSPLKEFLTENGTPLKTVTDVQNVLGEYVSALRDFRKFLKANQSAELNIYLSPYVFEKAITDNLKNSCEYTVGQDGSYTVTCDYANIATLKLNTADLIALTQYSSGEILAFGFYNSYSLEGIEKLADFDPNGLKSNSERVNFMASLPQFGKLRNDHIFSMLTEIGSDMSAAVKWAIAYQKEICPAGYYAINQRKGYLFSNGLCIGNQTETEASLAFLDQALKGSIRVDITRPNQEVVSTEVNYFAWAKSPIQDLRQIRPTTWNKCDKATSLNDNTFGGVLVDNNAPLFLKTDCSN